MASDAKSNTRSAHQSWPIGLMSLVLFAPVCVSAQETSEDWKISATVYGWFPDIGGETRFPSGGAGTIDVDISTILDHLKMTFQVALEVRKGRWGAFTDLVYLDVGDANSRTRNVEIGGVPLPATVTAAMDFDLKSMFLTLAGAYRVTDSPGATLDVLLGARLASFDQTLDWEFTGNFGPVTPPPLTGTREASIDFWDGIVGVKGRLAFGAEQKWVVPFHFDAGTGDSDVTWQAMVGLGYGFGWGDLGVAWRYLDYDLGSDGPVADMNFNGPGIGATFRW